MVGQVLRSDGIGISDPPPGQIGGRIVEIATVGLERGRRQTGLDPCEGQSRTGGSKLLCTAMDGQLGGRHCNHVTCVATISLIQAVEDPAPVESIATDLEEFAQAPQTEVTGAPVIVAVQMGAGLIGVHGRGLAFCIQIDRPRGFHPQKGEGAETADRGPTRGSRACATDAKN